jgi:hypothetical protein
VANYVFRLRFGFEVTEVTLKIDELTIKKEVVVADNSDGILLGMDIGHAIHRCHVKSNRVRTIQLAETENTPPLSEVIMEMVAEGWIQLRETTFRVTPL